MLLEDVLLTRATRSTFDLKERAGAGIERDSGYDDEIAFRYHFPKQYRAIAETLVGDRIIYREPQRNGGRRVATAKVVAVEDDPTRLGHAYAVMAEYQEFDEPVPFVRDGRYWETSLLSVPEPSRVGAFLLPGHHF